MVITCRRFNFAKWTTDDIVFRGSEIQRQTDGSIVLRMRSYALGLSIVSVPRARRATPKAPLDEKEIRQLRDIVGELSWLS